MDTPINKNTVRSTAIDFIRCISIAGVVLIHATSRTLEQSGYDIYTERWLFFLNQFARFAVPMLFFLSGFTLARRYSEKFSIVEFYKKRAWKVIVPYVVWSVFFYFFIQNNSISQLFSIGFLKTLLLEGTAYYHLYFIPPLVAMYVLFPYIVRYKHIFFRTKWLLLATFLQIILLSVDYYFSVFMYIPNALRITMLNLYLFGLGMVAHRYEEGILLAVAKHKGIILGMTITTFLIVCFNAFLLRQEFWDVRFVVSQWRVDVNVYTVFLATLLLWVGQYKLTRFKTALAKLADISFFVYFIHVLFINIFWKFLGSYLFSRSQGHIGRTLWFDPIVFVFVLVCSFGVAYMGSFLPKRIKWIVGL
jgi:peptidoglycan/LPS O-acetylase OafA/YrhL